VSSGHSPEVASLFPLDLQKGLSFSLPVTRVGRAVFLRGPPPSFAQIKRAPVTGLLSMLHAPHPRPAYLPQPYIGLCIFFLPGVRQGRVALFFPFGDHVGLTFFGHEYDQGPSPLQCRIFPDAGSSLYRRLHPSTATPWDSDKRRDFFLDRVSVRTGEICYALTPLSSLGSCVYLWTRPAPSFFGYQTGPPFPHPPMPSFFDGGLWGLGHPQFASIARHYQAPSTISYRTPLHGKLSSLSGGPPRKWVGPFPHGPTCRKRDRRALFSCQVLDGTGTSFFIGIATATLFALKQLSPFLSDSRPFPSFS